MNDPIVGEIRRVREAHAAAFNYDLDAIFLDIKEQERRSGRTFVSFVDTGKPNEPSASPNEPRVKAVAGEPSVETAVV